MKGDCISSDDEELNLIFVCTLDKLFEVSGSLHGCHLRASREIRGELLLL